MSSTSTTYKPSLLLMALVALSGFGLVHAKFDACSMEGKDFWAFDWNDKRCIKCGDDKVSDRWKNCQLSKNLHRQIPYSRGPSGNTQGYMGYDIPGYTPPAWWHGPNIWQVTCPYQTTELYYDARVVGQRMDCKEGGLKEGFTISEEETKSQSFSIGLSLNMGAGGKSGGIEANAEGGLSIGWSWAKSSTRGNLRNLELSCPVNDTKVKCIKAAEKRIHVYSDQCWIATKDGLQEGDYHTFEDFDENGVPKDCIPEKTWRDQFDEASGAAEGSSSWYMWQDEEENCMDLDAYISMPTGNRKRRLGDH